MDTVAPTAEKPMSKAINVDAIERALERGRRDDAATLVDSVSSPDSSDLDSLRRLMRAAAELERPDLADACLERARAQIEDTGTTIGAAVALFESERAALSGDYAAAAEPLSLSSGENIVVPALREIHEAMSWTDVARAPSLPELPAQLLWFEPVAVALLFELERRVQALPPSVERHWTRATLFRPDFRPEAFSKPSTSLADTLLGWTRGAARREYDRREREVDERLHAGDFDGAASLIENWLEDDSGALKDPGDVRVYFLAALHFHAERFDAVTELGDRVEGDISKAGGDLIALLAYSAIARRDLDSARALLHASLAESRERPSAELAHLVAIVELESAGGRADGAPARVFPWLRRAYRGSDIAMVELIRREHAFVTDASASNPNPGSGT